MQTQQLQSPKPSSHNGEPEKTQAIQNEEIKTIIPEQPPQKLIFDPDSKKFYEVVRGRLFERCVEATGIKAPEVCKPYLAYFGPRIKMEDCKKVLAFFAWTQAKSRSEAMVRWFSNVDTGEIKPWAFPQWFGTGMTVKELTFEEMDKATQDMYQTQRGQFGRGWEPAGTWHHHCTTAAFQSGVDHSDELDQNGLHVTVGKLDEPFYDIHARVVFSKVQYAMAFQDWFEIPPEAVKWFSMKFLIENIAKWYFAAIPKQEFESKEAFPEEWKLNLVEKKYGGNQLGFGGGHFQPRSCGAGGSGSGSIIDFAMERIERLYELRADIVKFLPVNRPFSDSVPELVTKLMANQEGQVMKEILLDREAWNLTDADIKLVFACMEMNKSIATEYQKLPQERYALYVSKGYAGFNTWDMRKDTHPHSYGYGGDGCEWAQGMRD